MHVIIKTVWTLICVYTILKGLFLEGVNANKLIVNWWHGHCTHKTGLSSNKYARQRIHIKHQALFSSKDKSKNKLKCRLLQFLFGALMVNSDGVLLYRFGRLIRELRALPMVTTSGGENNLQSFDLFRRTHLFWSISILSLALNKVSAKYTFGHFPYHLLNEATYSNGFVSVWKLLKTGFETDKQCRFSKPI